MNESLLERFRRSNHGAAPQKANVDVWLLPQKLNRLVRDYYEPTTRPAGAGPWFDRPELPTPAEVLDLDGDGFSNSNIVELVPNRTEGAWESTGTLPTQLPRSWARTNLRIQRNTCPLITSYCAKMPFVRSARVFVTSARVLIRMKMLSAEPSESIKT